MRNRKMALRKKAMLAALEKHLGIVTHAALTAGIDRVTHYEWMKTDPEYRARVEGLDNLVVDFAESSLLKQIRAGQPAATIFFLKTKGRSRGYIERKELDVTTAGNPLVKPPIVWTDDEFGGDDPADRSPEDEGTA